MAYALAGKSEMQDKNTVSIYVLLILTSLLLTSFIVAPLNVEDRISLNRGLCIFALGLVFFSSLFNFTNYIVLYTEIGNKFRKKYNLTKYDLLDISNKIVSSIQALMSCLSGAVIYKYSCTKSFMKSSHFISEGYPWFGLAYFLYDIWSMFKVHTCMDTDSNQNGDCSKSQNEIKKFAHYIVSQPLMVGHHLFIATFGFLFVIVLRGNLGDCLFAFIFMMELSTPLVNLRGILSKIGLKSSRFYVINGLVMLVTFFLCRIAMFPYVFYLYAEAANKEYFEAIFSLPRGCKVGIAILLLPQFYWLLLMIKGATKVICSPKAKYVSNSNNRKQISANHNHS